MSEFECHNVARRTIMLALSAKDTDYTADTTYLCEAWQLLLERHEPSRGIDVSDLYQKLSVATQRGRNMVDHVNECMTYRNRLRALGADIPREFFIQKLLDVDEEYMFMRASLRTQTPEQIVAALMEHYQLFQRHKDNDRRGGQAPACQNRPRFNRPRGQGRPPAVAVAAIRAGGGEQRSCHHCGKKAHLRQEGAPAAPLSGSIPGGQEVLSTGTGQGEVMNRGDRGITFPAMSMEKFNELVNLPPAQSPFDPDHLLIDSGSDISLVWNENMFTCMEPCSLKQCTPVGSTPLSVQAIGVIRFNLVSYVECHGQRYPLDLEIQSVYYCCKPGTLPMGRSLIPRACRQDICTVIPDGAISVYIYHVQFRRLR